MNARDNLNAASSQACGAMAAGPSAVTAFSFELGEQVSVILAMACSAAAVSTGELINRAIVFYAEHAIGLPMLEGGNRQSALGNRMRSAPRDSARLPLTVDGDLTDLPTFSRLGPNCFTHNPDSAHGERVCGPASARAGESLPCVQSDARPAAVPADGGAGIVMRHTDIRGGSPSHEARAPP